MLRFEGRSKQPDFCSHSSQTCIGPAGALPIQVKTSSTSSSPPPTLYHHSCLPHLFDALSLRCDGLRVIVVVVLPKEYIFLLTHLEYIPHGDAHTVFLLASPGPKATYPRVSEGGRSLKVIIAPLLSAPLFFPIPSGFKVRPD